MINPWRLARAGAALAALGTLLILAHLLSLPVGGTESEEPLPDLAVAPLEDFTLEARADGRRLLRFSATIVNLGEAPLEIIGRRTGALSPVMRVTQLVAEEGARRERPISATMTYSGDGHDHWHVDNVMQYDLWSSDGEYRASHKTGFCFWDNREHDLSLAGAPAEAVYAARLCGDLRSVSNRMGLSVGWGDRYRHTLAWQWIDITGLPDGEYLVRAVADPAGHFHEHDRDNNCAWTRIGIAGDDAGVLADGAECVPPPQGVEPRLAVSPLLVRVGCSMGILAADALTTVGSSPICPRFR